MKELVEVIAKALVDDPESDRKTWKYCQCYPFISKSSGSEVRQESDCRYSGLIRMDIGTDRVLPGLSLFMKKEMCPPEQ